MQRAACSEKHGPGAGVDILKEDGTMKRCAFCGGGLGLISHRKGRLRFCKRTHKAAYLERRRQQQAAGHLRNWFAFLSAGLSRPRLAASILFGRRDR